MGLEGRVHREIESLQHKLLGLQSTDGAWRFGVETGPMTDAYILR